MRAHLSLSCADADETRPCAHLRLNLAHTTFILAHAGFQELNAGDHIFTDPLELVGQLVRSAGQRSMHSLISLSNAVCEVSHQRFIFSNHALSLLLELITLGSSIDAMPQLLHLHVQQLTLHRFAKAIRHWRITFIDDLGIHVDTLSGRHYVKRAVFEACELLAVKCQLLLLILQA